MPRLMDRYGAPFDVIFMLARATEDGKTLRSAQELAAIVAHAIHAYGSAGIGVEAGGLLNNLFTLLLTLTDDNELRMLGTIGFVRAEFDAGVVVREYLVPVLAAHLLAYWADATDESAAAQAEAAAAEARHLHRLNDFLSYVQMDDDGKQLFVSFDDFLAERFAGRSIGAREYPSEFIEAEAAYRADLAERLARAGERARACSDAYGRAVLDEATTMLNNLGPTAGLAVLDAGVRRVSELKAELSSQRDAVEPELELLEAAVSEDLVALDAAASHAGFFRSVKEEVRQLAARMNEAFGVRRSWEMPGPVLQALSDANELLGDAAVRMRNGRAAMVDAVSALSASARSFEKRSVAPLEELIRRPLHDGDDLHALYQMSTGYTPGAFPAGLEPHVHARVGDLETWPDIGVTGITDAVHVAMADVFSSVSRMTADGFVSWKCGRTGSSPASTLRELASRAPLLCRFNRARIPEDDGVYEDAFTVIGVTDSNNSAFFGTDQGTLVTTGDTAHISILRLAFGMPPSSLWAWDRMKRAHDARTAADRECIYPGLRDAQVVHARRPRPRTRG